MKITALFALLAISNAHAATPVIADCYDSTGQSLSEMAYHSFRVFEYNDPARFITLQGEDLPGGWHETFTRWTGRQVIKYGRDYAIVLHLRFQTQKPMGDMIFNDPNATASAILLYKGTPISSASVDVRQLNDNPDAPSTVPLEIGLTLDNLPLRVALGAGNEPGASLLTLLNQAPNKTELFQTYGSGHSALANAEIRCSIPMPEGQQNPLFKIIINTLN